MTAYQDLVAATSGVENQWKFDGNGNDSIGSKTFTIATGYSTGTAGKHNDALTANSTASKTGSYVASPGISSLFGSAYSIEFLFKYTTAGQAQELLRVNDEIALEMGTDGKILYYALGASGTTAASWGDGNWHHMVITRDGSRNVVVYIDGTSRITFTQGTGTPANGNFYMGGSQYTSQAAISGQIDEVSTYNVALSSGTVSSHYTAAFSTSVDFSVEAATMTVQAHDAASGQRVYISPTRDGYATQTSGDFSGGANGSATTLRAGRGNTVPNYYSLYYFDVSSIPSSATVEDANLSLYVTGKVGAGSSATYSAYRLASAYSNEASVPAAGTTTGAALSTKTDANVSTSAYNDFGVTAAVAGWVAGTFTNNGLTVFQAATPDRYLEINSKEAGTNPPVLEVIYAFVPVSVEVTTSTQTASAQSYDVSVETDTDLSLDTATAALAAHDVTVEEGVTPDAIVDVATLNTYTQAYDAIAVQNITVDADSPSAATLSAHDATVEEASNALIDLDTPRILWTHHQLTDVNGEPIAETEEEDKFFVSTMNLAPHIWYRFNLTSGTEENARVYMGGENNSPGRYYGATIGLNGGPNGRKYVHFNGTARFEQFETTPGYLGGESYGPVSTLEFSLRTEKQNQFIMRMDDATEMPLTDRSRAKDIYLKDGKFYLRVWAFNPLTQKNQLDYEFLGYSNIADGEWHHITVVNAPGNVDNPFYGLSLYVDGELELHRRYAYGLSFPDFIGGRSALPGLNDPMYAAIPLDSWFVGDMTEVVSYKSALSQDQIYRQNDGLFGYDPVYLEPARAALTAHEASPKTNAKRILTINLGARDAVLRQGSTMVGFQGLSKPGSSLTNGVQVGAFQFFAVDAYWAPEDAPGPLGFQWWEPKYDVNRMLDLEKDLNLEDFDILNVINYPTTGQDFDDLDAKFSQWSLYGGPSARKQLENLMAQVRDFAVNGGALYITDPATAKAVGVIDDYDFVDQLIDSKRSGFDYGNSGGDHDLRAAKLNPWGDNPNGASTTIWNPRVPPYQTKPSVDYNRLAHFYRDEHANFWQTVRNTVDGLTDIPGWVLVDAIEFSPYLDSGTQWAEKWVNKEDGLVVGDTVRIMGTRGAGRGEGPQGLTGVTSRVFGQVATPVSAVKAGTVVTTFAPTYWAGDTLSANPYADWATSVVVQPGDTLNGQLVQGRIYMNFSEGFADLAAQLQTTAVDQIPEVITNPAYFETAESREWTYSTWRGSWADAQTSGGTSTETVIDENGNVTIKELDRDTIVGAVYTHRWPVMRVAAPYMTYRGLQWVSGGQDADGNATVGVATATATAKANDATVEAQKSATVELATARVIAQAWDDKDTVNPDAEVLVLTAQIATNAVPFTEAIDLETATVTVKAHEDIDGIMSSADLVILRLPNSTATLTLEER